MVVTYAMVCCVLRVTCVVQVRSVRAVTAVCNDRSEALAAYSTAQHDLDAKKVGGGGSLGTCGGGEGRGGGNWRAGGL
jgi:hypothetical protein